MGWKVQGNRVPVLEFQGDLYGFRERSMGLPE
jgi:hypothetical protein